MGLNRTGYKITIFRATVVAQIAGPMLVEGHGGRAGGGGGRAFIDQVILASSAPFSLSVSYLVPFSPLISQFVKVQEEEPMATVKSLKTDGRTSESDLF